VDRREHWDAVFARRRPDRVSWYQVRPALSLDLIELAGADPKAGTIDVGGGASSLVDELLARGFEDVAVLDVSGAALELTRARLGDRAARVEWLECDVTGFEPRRQWGLWHDRAVFHFLTEPADRDAYVRVLDSALRVGGSAIIAAFSLQGPERCSGLDVVRYSPQSLLAELGGDYELVESRDELHVTPSGAEQAFMYCLLQRVAGD